MAGSQPEKFEDVAVACKANVYFDGGVVSHSIFFKDGSRKSLGLIRPGTYRFDTGAPERMDISHGSCRVRLAGEEGWKIYSSGSGFDVPGNSHFEVAVDEGIAEYICSFG